jgi:hypothetical protein
VTHGSLLVLVEQPILDGAPIKAVSYLEPEENWDSGYAIWTSEPDRIGDTELIHVGCLLEDFPDLAPSLRYAREHGEWIDGAGV